MRLRRRGEDAYLTVKRGVGRQRTEIEIELGAEQFEALWPLTAGRRISKARRYVRIEAGEIEVDVYRGGLEGLITAEIEFDPGERPESFRPPEWLADEVTGNPGYANKSLATRGRPTDAPTADAATKGQPDRDLARRRSLAAMVEQLDVNGNTAATGNTPVGASLEAPGARLTSALEDLDRQPDPTRRNRLTRYCLEYGAAAIAAAEALFEGGELTAQVRPTKDRILQLIGEQDLGRDWMRSEVPTAAWREAFSVNQSEIVDGTGPPPALFDRLIAAAGLAADLCAWLEAAGPAEASGAAKAPSAQRGG